ncbi:CDP-alcohol phosphatidyltransferase family protein [Okibacterium endophyticum]
MAESRTAPAVKRSFTSALHGLEQAQKPGEGVPAYTRWVNRRLARFAAAAAHSMGWSANTVTAISALFSLGAIVLLLTVPPAPLVGVAIAVLFAIGYVLDSADGQVARLGGGGSRAGEWLDHVVDAIRTPAIHLAVLVGAMRAEAPVWLLGVALLYTLVSVGQFMSQILGEQLRRADGLPQAPATGGALRSVLLLPSDMGTLCWVFALWGFAPVFAAAYTALFAVNALHSALSMRRRYRELSAR